MNPTMVGIIVFTSTSAGALLGMWLRATLPEHQFDADSKDTVKVGIGLIATMTALVLGLVTASAKSSFDAVNATVKQTAIQILTLDRALGRYGPEALEIRNDLKGLVGTRIDMIWPRYRSEPIYLDPNPAGAVSKAEEIAEAIGNLRPRDDSQRALQSRALDLAEALLQSRWFVITTGASVPVPFIVVLLFWLTITFASFGLFAPRKKVVVVVLLICAMSVGSAVFLILELDGPFDGLLKVSPDALRAAHAHLNH